jgi:DNA-binding SARP family transcriptional activator
LAELRILGPVELRTAGRAWELGPPKQRAVLAALLVDHDRTVSVDALVDRVWDDAAPATARTALQGYVMRLRRLFDAVGEATGHRLRLQHGSGGYRVEVAADRVDLHRFRRLVREARNPDLSPADRAAALRAALALWRGDPLADVTGLWADTVRGELAQERLDAAIAWARAELAEGNQNRVIPQLRRLAAVYPLAEPLAAALIRALLADGRRAEALDLHAAIRRRLADELGADPGAELQSVLKDALGTEDAGEPPDAEAAVAVPRRAAVPAQLPLDVYGFVGRDAELARLDRALATAADQPTAVVICALSGTAGVGKTSLAIHWAHRVRDRFPDGQLHVNLRGFDPTGPAMAPAEAVRCFLVALGVAPERIPVDLPDQVSAYRSLVADRRLLVVLDNARDAAQVRPLLPGAPGCLVIVTSRDPLPGLVAAEGAHAVPLDLLSPADACQLLARRLGPDRVGAEPELVREVVRWCAGLPLALSIAAARGAYLPGAGLATLAAELRDARGLPSAYAEGDPSLDARAVFSSSYRALSGTPARLFRVLGLHPGPDAGVLAAAALAGVPGDEAAAALGELVRAHLVTEPVPGRYTMHDLLRGYAAELAQRLDAEADRRAAIRRMLNHYLHTAHAGALRLHPHRDPLRLPPPAAGLPVAPLADLRQAIGWFAVEHRVLIGAIDQAASAGFGGHAWRLAWTMANYLERQGHWHDWAHASRVALGAARRLGDRDGQAHAHRGLGQALMRLGRYPAAQRHLRHALLRHRQLGDRVGQAHTRLNLALVCQRRERLTEALAHSYLALRLFTAVGHRAGLGNALNTVGWYHALLGDYRRALTWCQRGLALQRQIGDRHEQAFTLDSIGFAQHHLGRHGEAVRRFEEAIALWRDLGDRFYEADTTARLGDTHLAAGAPEAARTAWQRALAIFEDLDHPDAEGLRAKLSAADSLILC